MWWRLISVLQCILDMVQDSCTWILDMVHFLTKVTALLNFLATALNGRCIIWRACLEYNSISYLPASTGAVSPGYEGTKKFRIFPFNKVLCALVGTTTDWHTQNSRTMLSIQAGYSESILYVLTTAFANRGSLRVKPHTTATPSWKTSIQERLWRTLQLSQKLLHLFSHYWSPSRQGCTLTVAIYIIIHGVTD